MSDLQRNLVCPDRERSSIEHAQLRRDTGNVVHEAQVLNREGLWVWLRVDGKLGEGEDPRLLPAVDFILDCGGPQKIWPFRSRHAFFWGRHVHVRTADIVFSAVLTV